MCSLHRFDVFPDYVHVTIMDHESDSVHSGMVFFLQYNFTDIINIAVVNHYTNFRLTICRY